MTTSLITWLTLAYMARADEPRVAFYKRHLDDMPLRRVSNTQLLECIIRCHTEPKCRCVRYSPNECTTQSEYPEMNNDPDKSQYLYYVMDLDTNGTGIQENLALRRPTTESSAYGGRRYNSGMMAVDGRVEDDKDYLEFAFHSNPKTDHLPWWQVDLGQTCLVTAIHIINMQSLTSKLSHLEVRVGEEKFTSSKWKNRLLNITENVLCASHQGEFGHERTLKCHPCPVVGRYVSVQAVFPCDGCTSPVLLAREVKVYGSRL